MSFKSEAANVRAGLNSGSYKKKVDPFKGFFEELTYGLKKRDEEKRQEEKEKRQQARAVARATKAKQDAEDKAEKERTDLANFYLTSTGQSPTSQNQAALMTVIKGGNFTDFGSLDKHMSQYSTYNPGTPQDNIDSQMQSAGLLQPGDGPYKAKTEEANSLSPEGTIKFTGSKGKDVLSMKLDEVRYELGDTSLTTERRSDLERRLKSLTDVKPYEPTTLYKSDGSKVVARTAKEEATYLADGFNLVEGAKPEKFVKRNLYKEGGQIEVFDQKTYKELTDDGWSNVKPADATTFQKRTLYKDGTKLEVFNQEDLNTAIDAAWSAVEPAAPTEFDNRYVYKDGGELQVFNQADYDAAITDGWGAAKPAKVTDFKSRTLFKDGAKQFVTTQAEMTAAVNDGWSAIEPAELEEKVFAQRTLYGEDGTEVRVFTQSELTALKAEGWSNIKPAKAVTFQPRTLYGAGRQIEVFSATEMADALKLGYTSVKTDNEKYVARTYYKEGQEQKVLDQEQQDALEADGWNGIKLDDISQIMSDLDVDRKTASQIENGVLKVSTDFAGRPIVIDISQTSSQAVSPEGQATSEMPQETLDAALSQFYPNWKENLKLKIMIDGKEVSVTPSQIQNNESFKIQLEDLTGLEGAFGLGGAINKIIGKAGDIFGAELKAEQNKAITFMGNLRLNTLINLAAATAGGLRDSVWNKQQIIATLPEPARVFEGPIEARNKTRETLRSIQTSLKLLDQALASNTVAKAQISQSTITRASLRELEKTYLTVLKSFEGELGAVTPLPSSFIKSKSPTSGDKN